MPYDTTVEAVSDIVIVEPMDEAAVQELGRTFDVRYDHRLAGNPGALSGALAEARALIVRDRIVVDEDLLASAPRLQVVACLGDATRRIDTAACRARGIEVYMAIDGSLQATAQRIVAAIQRLLAGTGRAQPSEGWRLGLVGFGTLARSVAELAQGQGFRLAAYDPLVAEEDPVWQMLGVERMTLLRLLGESDAISLHLSLTQETESLIDFETLEEVRPGTVLVNASPAGVVDAGAVAAALRSGRLGGAVLEIAEGVGEDVTSQRLQAEARLGQLIARKVRDALEARRLT